MPFALLYLFRPTSCLSFFSDHLMFVILSLTGNPGKEVHLNRACKALKGTADRGFPIGVGNDKRKGVEKYVGVGVLISPLGAG